LPDNVVVEGPVDYAAVPDLLARARVGLMPFESSRLNEGRSPMKMYEYLAAGLTVVVPSYLDRVAGSLRPRVFSFAGPDGIADAINGALAAEPIDVGDALDEQAWPRKATQLQSFLHGVVSPPG
jgi:glycosyltransferase involved in cell wall biosynthesis